MLGRFFSAIGRLVTNANALANTLGEANTLLRDRLGLDALPPADGPRIIATVNDAPGEPVPSAEPIATSADVSPSANGRRRSVK